MSNRSSALQRGRTFGVWVAIFMVAVLALHFLAGADPLHAATTAHGLKDTLPHTPLLAIGSMAVKYTKVSDLSKAYKRSTTKLYRTYTRRVPEYRWFDSIQDEEIMPSGRENLILLDVMQGVGAHQVDDGGFESRTETPALQEGSFVFNHTNSRFAISLRAQAFDQKAKANQVIRQIKYQSLKCIEAVMRKYGFMTYGYSSGVVAQVNGNQANAAIVTVPLKNAFGQTQLNNAAYLASIFAIDEAVGFVRANALVNAGVVTAADPVAGTITVDFAGVNTQLNDGDQIVFANGVTGGTLSETDWQKWNSGLLEALFADTVHNVSQAAVPTWAPSLLDTNGGTFGFIKARKLRQALENKGDTVLRRIILANGVQNAKDALERSALIWTNTGAMNIDGNAKIQGVTEDTSRFTPPTCAFAIGADAMGKKLVTDKVDEEETIEFGKLYKAEDRSALKGGVDLISAMIYRSRSRLGGYIGLDEQ